MDIGFFGLIGVPLITHIPLHTMDKTRRFRGNCRANIVHTMHLINTVYLYSNK